MDEEAESAFSARMRFRLRVVAIGFVIIGGLGACLAGVTLGPDWRAAHGGGVTGTFTLTESLGCDLREPPAHRCDWLGDFRSDDGRTTDDHMEFVAGLSPAAQVGDMLPARDTGSQARIYPLDESRTWHETAEFFAGFFAAFVAGLVALRPWTWKTWPDRYRRLMS